MTHFSVLFATTAVLSLCFAAEINISPLSKNTTLGSNVNFTCGAVADFITFFINGTPTPFPIGFTQHSLVPDNSVAGLWKRTLTVTALGSTNNSNITCTVTTISPLLSNHSDVAIIRVQGLLASIGNLSIQQLNSTSIQLSWTPPYTLDNVPITGYYIDIINTTVNDTSAIITLTDIDPCTLTTISVYPLNGAGIGERANVSFYSLRGIKPLIPLSINLIVQDSRISLQVTIDVNNLCVREYPAIIDLKLNNVSYESLNLIMSSSHSSQLMGTRHIILNDTTVDIPLSVNASLYLSNGLPLDAITDIQFNIYTNFTVSPGTVCVICQLAVNDTGCILTIHNNTEILYNKTFPRNFAKGCIVDITEGRYEITVDNINENVVAYSHNVQYKLLTMLPPNPSLSISSSLTTSHYANFFTDTLLSSPQPPSQTTFLSSVEQSLKQASFTQSMETTSFSKPSSDLNTNAIIVITCSAGLVLSIVIITGLVVAVIIVRRWKKNSKNRKSKQIRTSTNAAYEHVQINTRVNDAYNFVPVLSLS